MVISRASVNVPNTFGGQTASYAHDTQYQEKKVIRTVIDAPIRYATPLIILTKTGTSQSGLQNYTSP